MRVNIYCEGCNKQFSIGDRVSYQRDLDIKDILYSFCQNCLNEDFADLAETLTKDNVERHNAANKIIHRTSR